MHACPDHLSPSLFMCIYYVFESLFFEFLRFVTCIKYYLQYITGLHDFFNFGQLITLVNLHCSLYNVLLRFAKNYPFLLLFSYDYSMIIPFMQNYVFQPRSACFRFYSAFFQLLCLVFVVFLFFEADRPLSYKENSL